MRKKGIPFRFQAQIEERFDRPASKRWHAQFMCYPLGYFRGEGSCPGKALVQAWSKFRREIDPGPRWWVAAMAEAPLTKY